MRAARDGAHGLRHMPSPVLLSFLCASALSPLLPAAGAPSTLAAAATTALSSVGGGALSGIIANAVGRARAKDASDGSVPELEEQVAEEISRVLAAGGGTAQARRG